MVCLLEIKVAEYLFTSVPSISPNKFTQSDKFFQEFDGQIFLKFECSCLPCGGLDLVLRGGGVWSGSCGVVGLDLDGLIWHTIDRLIVTFS